MERLYLNGNDWEFKDYLGEDWVWRNGEKRNTQDIRWWHKGQVPGSVTHDLWKLQEIPDPYFERNSLLIEWIPQRTWIYRKRFYPPESMKGQKITLHFEGVDYEGLFYLNDVLLGEHKGMYTPFQFDVTDHIDWQGENQLSVVLQKAPDEQPQVSKTAYVKTHKSRMTYWWDFCPRMIHLGIWDNVYLEAHGRAVVDNIFVRPMIKENGQSVQIVLETTITSTERFPGKLQITITQDNFTVAEYILETELFQGINKLSGSITISDPKLWWPNGYGEQPLYTINAKLYTGSENRLSHDKQDTFGIRSLAFLPNVEAELGADSYTMSVNGQKIYIKGWNWVPIDVMYGVKREEKLRHLLRLAKEAHVNMLRVWGGGLIEREDFYNLCDEYGILVWQEFIQSSSGIDNKPSEEPAFLAMMEQEAQQIIPRKRNHASLAIWCGGNELQSENQSMIKNSEPVIRVLRRAVLELDPDRKFLPSSPSGRIFNNDLQLIQSDPNGLHDVHGPWEHQGLTMQYTLYNSGTSLLSSEYGVEGMTHYNTLQKTMDTLNMWPPSRDNITYFHRGSWWNNYVLVQECFGNQIQDIETMIQASQLMQYEGLKYAVESNRRRAFYNSGSLMWQFNEPYPNNYCTSSIDYYGQPKPVYHGIQKAYAPIQITAVFPAQALAAYGTIVEFLPYVHNSYEQALEVTITYAIAGSSGKIYTHGRQTILAENESTKALPIKIDLDAIQDNIFLLILTGISDQGEMFCENRYLFTKDKDLSSLPVLTKVPLLLRYEDCSDSATKNAGVLTLKNTGASLAAGVKLMLDAELGQDHYAYFSDNFLYLLPGEEKSITVTVTGIKTNYFTLHISGFGTAPTCIICQKT